MIELSYKVARRFWPEIDLLSTPRRIFGVGNVLFFLYTFPLAIWATVWLVRVSDWQIIADNALFFVLLGGLMILFGRLSFYTIIEIHPGTYANADSSLSGVILWVGLLLFGPTILWLPAVGKLLELIWELGKAKSVGARWVRLRIFTLYYASVILTALIVLPIYQGWGATLPLAGLTLKDVVLATGAILFQLVLFALVYSGFIAYVVWAQNRITTSQSTRQMLGFLAISLGAPYLAYPFGILAAGVYAQNGIAGFLFFAIGLSLVAVLARKLSEAAEASRQQSRQLQQLERLSRDIINGAPDGSEIEDILARHVPVMFPTGRFLIWVQPERYLMHHPEDWSPSVDNFWEWLQENQKIRAFPAGESRPWRAGQDAPNPIVVVPVFAVETHAPIGFIYAELQSLVQPWKTRALLNLYPAFNALAAQVASAIYQAEVYADALDLQRAASELEFASEIQASFLPDKIPVLPGWELAVTILPAREMAGDFFDLIRLSDNHIAILIADVADKGVGPALYMALSRTLFRTYLMEYDFEPDTVFFAANRRILQDARANLFVTVFLGILDQETGVLTYSNAGHNPPYLIRGDGGGMQPLRATGMPIGIEEESVWKLSSVVLDPGDMLVLYTDGIPDAQNEEGEFFEEETLVDIAEAHTGCPAHEIQASIIDNVSQFVGDAPQFDDITLMILTRDKDGTTPVAGDQQPTVSSNNA